MVRRPPRRGASGLMVAALAVSLLGVVGATALWVNASEAAHLEDESRAELVARVLQAEAERLVGTMRGGSGLISDGVVSQAEFDAYAADVLGAEPFQAVGLVERIPHAEREAYEDATGAPIQARGADGVLGPAPVSDSYWILRATAPAGNPGASMVGADIAPDEAREIAFDRAVSERTTVLSAPVEGLATGRPSFLVVSSLVPPSGTEPRTFLIASVQFEVLVASALAQLPEGTKVAVSDGGVALTPLLDGAPESTVDVATRTWTVAATDGASPSRAAALGVALVTQLAALGIVVVGRRDQAHRARETVLVDRLDRDRERATSLAALGRAVAVARTPLEVSQAAALYARHVVGARSSSVGLLDDSGAGLIVVHDTELSPSAGEPFARQALDAPLPLAEAARTGELVACPDTDAVAARYPHAAADLARSGLSAVAAVPLIGPDGPLGALGFAWEDPVTLDEGMTRALGTVGDVCAQALTRAVLGDRRERRARHLTLLTQSLAVAPTPAAVVAALEDNATGLFDAAAAHLLLETGEASSAGGVEPPVRLAEMLATPDARGSGLTRPAREQVFLGTRGACLRRYPALEPLLEAEGTHAMAVLAIMGSDDHLLARLCLLWKEPVLFDPGLRDELRSVAEIVSQNLERADLIAAEHELADSLQRRILTPLPEAAGVQLAARYVPAARNVGIGGDWYDVVVRGTTVTLVVGDVVGHGLEAIARMTELRAIVNGLVNAGMPLTSVIDAVGEMDDPADPTYATVQLLEIDTSAGVVTHISAGHPPALLVHDGHAEFLDGGRAALLGVPRQPVTPGVRALPPGALVVAYTDGLVERRGHAIDDGLDDLLAAAATAPLDADGAVEHLLSVAASPHQNPDDVVVLAARLL